MRSPPADAPSGAGPAAPDDACALHATVVEAVEAVRSTLARKSLAALAADYRRDGALVTPVGGHPAMP